jgi:hypothetical protein
MFLHDSIRRTDGDGDDAAREDPPGRYPWGQVERKAEHKPLHMSWVVVTDENGKRQLRMHWVAIEGC